MIRPKPEHQQRTAGRLIVRALNASAQRGYLQFGTNLVPCALGTGGIRAIKREGDGAAPRGRFRLLSVFYRPDGKRPRSGLPVRAIRKMDGWCDSVNDRNYNRRVSLPYPQSTEPLWRADRLYDVIVVLGYNDVPRVRGRGSAIFIHVAREGFTPTEGCVALRASDLRRMLCNLHRGSDIVIAV
ncbi:hypothetical protein DLM45_07985 [Hyphomicrobium methylovorum]|uniref:L,D-transpeptidase family protein n=1 Tax=Hyphomicrobium methylovorum TaxID=84 RepID=UPI0015E77F1F|nr:L,D-transpeptidase family protein [Hyphomicrobium methylovorum]MBA2126162.1 hypothetical protein [Hyphomicrobium methylovorum]